MADKINLDKIKEEIKSRKEEGNVVPQHLGENVKSLSSSPRDEFLNGLMTSLKTGTVTPSSNLVKEVHNTVVDKKGGDKSVTANQTRNTAPQEPRTKSTMDMSPDRENKMYEDFEKMKKSTLAESINEFNGGDKANGNNSSVVNFNGQQYLTTPPTQSNQNQGTSQQLNEDVLVENVKSIVTEHLNQNLAPIFEDAIKNTIIEMYAVERIQEVLKENRDLIKSVVVETIKEIRNKSKTK